MTIFVSLFRGINVGGNRIVKMPDLKALHEALGLQNVVTYIQSGNVIFTSDTTDTTQLERDIEAAFSEKFGFHSHVVVRSLSDIQALIANTPFQNSLDKEAKWIAVLFLSTHPADNALAEIRKAYSGPEEIVISGKDVYLYYPEGVGRSKLTSALLDKKLQTHGTARNWNTVLKLQELSVSLSS